MAEIKRFHGVFIGQRFQQKGETSPEMIEQPPMLCLPLHTCPLLVDDQVEQWFSILQHKRFNIADFVSIDDLSGKIYLFIDRWNRRAYRFRWVIRSVAKLMVYAEPLKKAA